MKNNLLHFLLISFIFSPVLNAYTLQESIVDALRTNPVIQERLKNFRATQQDLNIAESEYYPSLDLRASGGYTKSGNIKNSGDSDFDHTVKSAEYRSYESSLTFTQNLFSGFSTMNKVDFEEARILSAAYKYLETSNDIAFKMTNAYIEVLKSDELVGTSRENVEINENIYNKVKDLFEAGLTTDSEVKKIQSTLSLARSNLIVQKNNALDSQYKYRRILGRLPEISKMQKPFLDVKMPSSIERAALYAIENNPSLLVSRYNIKGAQSLYKQKGKEYYPTVDIELSQNFNDHDLVANGFDQADDRFRARVVFSYNLFRGGADKANIQKHISKLNQEIEIQRDLKRQVVEGLDLSWNAYEMIENQLVFLKEYSQYSEKTLDLYKEEYDLGRRSLLDLLSAQNDVINSRSQIIKAEYDQLFAKYRILDAMGLLVVAINGTADEFTAKVNLYTDDEAQEVLDSVDIELDVDNDKITDNLDLCDNSLKENNIMPYGCKKIKQAVLLPDSDADGVEDSKDISPDTPAGYEVDENGLAELVTLSVNFQKDSTELPEDLDDKIIEFSDYLKKHTEVTASIVGHTSRTNVSKHDYNMKLSTQRADRVRAELINYGIRENRLTASGKGYTEPMTDNDTQEGRAQNRRVEIELIRNLKEEELLNEI